MNKTDCTINSPVCICTVVFLNSELKHDPSHKFECTDPHGRVISLLLHLGPQRNHPL